MAIDYHNTGYGTEGDSAARDAFFKKFGYDNNNWQTYENKFASATDDFAGQFKQLVGRDPTQSEVSSYLGQVVGGSGLDAFGNNRGLELSQLTSNFIGSRYADEADKVATQKLTDQQGEATRLSDLFRSQGNQTINDTEFSLLDYQNKLFERLRPNLITSLQSQGLLNTGGLNQAIAGAQGDLATAGSDQLRQERLANDQAANQISFAGASAPYQYQQNQIMNTPTNLQNASQTGLSNAYNTFTNQLNFQNQSALINQQYALAAQLKAKNSGGFFSSLGNSLAPSLGTSIGSSLGQWFNPSTASTAMKGGF